MSLEFNLLTFVSISTTIVIILFITLILVYLTTNPYPCVTRYTSEEKFYDSKLKAFKQFPKLRDSASIDLSIIIPAYNEEKRLIPMLDEAIDFLEKIKVGTKFCYEIIVVDDGSKDSTTEVGLRYADKYSTEIVRVLRLERNRGKGGAVRLGMLSSRGKELLFADADGATKFSDIDKLRAELKVQLRRSDCNMALVCGSRAHLEKQSISKRSFFRTILMYGFQILIWVLCTTHIKDTQCGFKLFSRSAARILFGNMHIERWAFDVDLLYLSTYFRIPVSEVCVQWTEIDGSKIIPVFSWLQMAKDIFMLRLRYALGAWKIEPSHNLN